MICGHIVQLVIHKVLLCTASFYFVYVDRDTDSNCMIKHLYIKNFVLIDELDLDLRSGFSAFTGETGAGKSILIDAISLLCAERGSSSFVMKGADTAIVEGTFDLTNNLHARRVMAEAGLVMEDETTFTREIHSSGKSTVRIDRRIATLALLKDVLRDEIDIHGQRDNAYLLKESLHVHLLDKYLQDDDLLMNVAVAYKKWQGLVKEKQSALDDAFNENDLQYYNYQIKEIEEAGLQIGEEEELEEKERQYKTVKDSFDKMNMCNEIYSTIEGDLYELKKTIDTLKGSDRITKIQNDFNDAYYTMTDALETLAKIREEMDLSEDEINAMEERLFIIQKMKRKYGHNIAEILDKKDEYTEKIRQYEHKSEFLAEIEQKISIAEEEYQKYAVKLSERRIKGAPDLDREVIEHLKRLMLPNARFKAEIQPAEPSAFGSDKVIFMISMNKGEDLKPLQKTASGGELSRLMLGLKSIFTNLQGIQTVIFDEIDTGVSGPVATAIGKEMHSLSSCCQVFAVTHLAQVASCADAQYLVSKADSDGKTRTQVTELDEEGRIRQLALIASGEITDASLKAAGELFKRNHNE